MKVFAVLANYGVNNDVFLRRVVEEYRSLPYRVHVAVLTNCQKTVPGADEIVVHRPQGDPLTFPFAHKAILAEKGGEYDLFIYSEDDTLISGDNIEAFLQANAVLDDGEITGFLRFERTADGRKTVSTVNGHFRWDPSSVVKRGQDTFAYFANEHAACYLLTREQLKRAIQSGGYLVPPHQGKYNLLETAATDPYTQCGFRKLICISQIRRFLIPHLPNKYVGRFGIELEELERQIEALKRIGEGAKPSSMLLRTESRLSHQRWSKRLYDPPSEEIAGCIAGDARTVLSFGCGTGDLEDMLRLRGLAVTAVPLDGVIGACVEARGIETICGDENSIWRSLGRRRFDCILVLDLLQLVPRPVQMLEQLAGLLSPNGRIVASVPNVLQAWTIWNGVRGRLQLDELFDYNRGGVHAVSFLTLRKWFAAAGLRLESVTTQFAPDLKSWQRIAGRLFPPGMAGEFVAVGAAKAGPIRPQ